MPVPRPTAAMKAAAAASFMGLLMALGLSCAPTEPEVDRQALYTPEALASELAYRYRQLNPDARSAAVRFRHNPKKEKELEGRLARAEQAKNKTSGGAPAKKKQAGPPTVDDLLADIDGKVDLIRGTSRADVCQKMNAAIAADTSIPDGDKAKLRELVGKLEGAQ